MSIYGNVCSKKGELKGKLIGFIRFFFNGEDNLWEKKKWVLMLKATCKKKRGVFWEQLKCEKKGSRQPVELKKKLKE